MNHGLINKVFYSGLVSNDQDLYEIYPDLNQKWWLFDEGEMISPGSEKSNNYYQTNDIIDFVNETEGSKLSILQALNKYLDEKIEKKDQTIIRLAQELGRVKEELKSMK
jgi:hypothetical protein